MSVVQAKGKGGSSSSHCPPYLSAVQMEQPDLVWKLGLEPQTVREAEQAIFVQVPRRFSKGTSWPEYERATENIMFPEMEGKKDLAAYVNDNSARREAEAK